MIDYNTSIEFLRIASAVPAIGITWYAAARDIATRKITNKTILLTIYIGLVLHIASAVVFHLSIWQDIAGLLWTVGFLFVLMIGWNFRLIGGGDVKLWAAMTLIIPLSVIQQQSLVLAVFVAGGIEAMIYQGIYMLGQAKSMRFVSPAPKGSSIVKRIAKIELRRAVRRTSMPYGVAIAIGTTFTILVLPMTGPGLLSL